MRADLAAVLVTATAASIAAAACGDACDPDQSLGTALDIAVCAPTGTFSTTSTNKFFPLVVGQKSIFVHPDGGRVEATVLDEVEVVAGVTTRVLHEYETDDGVLVEQSWNFFAQATDGTMCYFGERVDIYEDGVVASHDGQWRAGEAGARPGIVMPATPVVGTYHAQEEAPGVAEDHANIIAAGRTITVPHGTFTDTLETSEWTPLEPCDLSPKTYAAGLGLIDDHGAKLVAIEMP